MSMTLKIEIEDRATPVIEAVARAATRERLSPVFGRAGVNALRDHLFGLDRARPNQLGGKRTHFYAQAARGASYGIISEGALLKLNQVGIRQRYFGGTIRPVNRKFLTVPARAEAHGRRATEFNNLRFAIIGGQPALVEADATRVRKTAKGFRSAGETGGLVMFWLRRSVTQRGDTGVLPAESDMYGAILAAGRSYVERVIARARAGGEEKAEG